MNEAQKQALATVVADFISHVEQTGKLNETYTHPATGKVEKNMVFVDMRQLKILAGLPVEAEIKQPKLRIQVMGRGQRRCPECGNSECNGECAGDDMMGGE